MDWLDVTVWIRKKIEWIRKRTASIVSGSFFFSSRRAFSCIVRSSFFVSLFRDLVFRNQSLKVVLFFDKLNAEWVVCFTDEANVKSEVLTA